MPKSFSRLTPEDVERVLGPLDYAIFDLLPIVGTQLGYHVIKMSTKHLTGQLNAPFADKPEVPKLTPSEVGARLRLLKAGEFVEPILSSVSRVDGWVKTRKAAEWLERRDKEGS